MPKLKLKILIDSGASDSIINPEIAVKFPMEMRFKENFTIKSVFTTFNSNQNINVPIFAEYEVNDPVKFRILKWHDKFDALIGTNDLEKLNAQICYKNNIIRLKDVIIPFQLGEKKNNLLPVTQVNGYAYLPETKINNNLTIPHSIHEVINGHIEIPNLTIDDPLIRPLEVQNLNNFNIQTSEKTNKKLHNFNPNILRMNHLNNEEKEKLIGLCKRYSHLFHDNNENLSATTHTKHFIRTQDENPVYTKSFRHPHAMQEEIKKQIDKLLDQKIIRPSVSPYSSPVWIVPKKMDASGERKFRMVIDFRKLNEKTVENKFPLPRIDEILDNLGKATYFTCLDLSQGFHQIKMHPDSIEKTAFTVPQGHYEYLRMPFGLKNAPSSFQTLMTEVLAPHINKRCFVYLDDIIIFSKSLHDHLIDLKLIFDSLATANLKIQIDKSEFLTKKVEFLGHVVTPDGITPNPSKIEAITKYPIPKTVKEIKSFLGLVGYYRRFIPDFAKVTFPLNKCTRKREKIDTTNCDYKDAFEKCKQLIINSPILTYPDFSLPFTLTTDASDIALGSVLSQQDKPIAFYSRTLNSAERNYSTIEKELLSILESVKHFRPYLYGRHFTILTDHNPLVWLANMKTPNSRLIRWKIKLDEYQFDIKHLKGSSNYVADALSRIELNVHEKHQDDTDSMSPMIINTSPNRERESEPQCLPSDSDSDESLNKYLNFRPPPPSTSDTIHSQEENISAELPISEKPINLFRNQIIINITRNPRYEYIKRFNKDIHFVYLGKEDLKNQIISNLIEIIDPSKTYGIFLVQNKYLRPILEQIIQEKFISINVSLCLSKLLDIEDEDEQVNSIKNYHNLNHNGINETYLHLKKSIYFPNLKDVITKYINSCELCLKAKYERHPYKIPFQGPILPTKPLHTLHIDVFHIKAKQFLTIIDPFSKYAQAYLIEDQTGISILNKLRHFFSHHNFPKRIVFDNATNFNSNVITEYLKLYKIEKHVTTTANSTSNSPIERLHSTLLEKLKILQIQNSNERIDNLMITAITIYNQSIHSSTNFTPFTLLYGPYEDEVLFDNDLTIYENYNERRKNEVQPFLEYVYKNTKERMVKNLQNANQNRQETIPEINPDTAVYRNRKQINKNTPHEKIKVIQQNKTQITGLTPANRIVNTDIKNIKRIRKQ